MAIAYRSSATNASAASTVASLSVNVPTGVADGDVLIWTHYNRVASATEPAAPSGWTKILALTVTSPVSFLTTFYHVVTTASSEPASYTINMSPSAHCASGISAYSGVDNTTPMDVAANAQQNANGTTAVAPAITPVTANVMLVFAAYAAGSSPAPTWTEPTGMAERYESANTATNVTSITNDDETYNNPNVSTGTRTATDSRATNFAHGAMLMALRPASGSSFVKPPARISVAQAVSRSYSY